MSPLLEDNAGFEVAFCCFNCLIISPSTVPVVLVVVVPFWLLAVVVAESVDVAEGRKSVEDVLVSGPPGTEPKPAEVNWLKYSC